ncbi:MAG TPA: glycoside hydrolase domain-containing protein [Candidatus Saccharimonadales bacterium]|jgi:hypothetical protein|nr:glycoside hydrolase domain-containing protein [Candidatus Saccharimonadales bacterium]
MRRASFVTFLLSAFAAVSVLPPFLISRSTQREDTPQTRTSAYLGFDLNNYPGDAALSILRKTFSFGGFWLNPPPGAKENTWVGKRPVMLHQKFGFLILYNGPLIRELKSGAQATGRGAVDAVKAAAAAKKEGFPAHSVIFLDIEEGGRLPANYHAYLRAWVDGLLRANYRAGVYCSGIPLDEGQGVTIITADDIRKNLGKRDVTYFVYNDACPPAPGCVVSHHPPPPSASGIPYAAVWQFAQSPRRKEFAARCAATYNADGNCYAPGDTKHAWFLDLNSATTPDPSSPHDRKASVLLTLSRERPASRQRQG